jgi:hypothetical protein
VVRNGGLRLSGFFASLDQQRGTIMYWSCTYSIKTNRPTHRQPLVGLYLRGPGGHGRQSMMSLDTCRPQSWARAFFYASRLRFRALWRSSSRWRFRALFWALNFALLRSRFRAPELLEFSRSFFALLDFSRSFFALLDFSRSYICDHWFLRS